MKVFLTYTAIIEAITGLGLMIIPSSVARILLNSVLSGSLSIVLAMVAGAAIFSLALGAWLNRKNIHSSATIKMLCCYNLSVALVLFLGVFSLGFDGIVLWGVILFHFLQTIIPLLIVQKQKRNV